MMKLDLSEMDALTAFCSAMPGINMKARNSAMKSIGFALKDTAKKATNNPNGLPSWPQITNLAKMVKVVKASPKPRPYEAFNRQTSDAFQGFALTGATATNPAGGKKASIILRPWGTLAAMLVYTLDEQEGALYFGFKAGIYGKKVAWVNAPTGANGQWGTNNQVGTVTKMKVENFISERAVNICKQITEGYTYEMRSAREQRYYAALGFPMPMGYRIITPPRPLVGPSFGILRPDIPALFKEKFWASYTRNMYPQSYKLMEQFFGKTKGGAQAVKK